MQRNTLAALVLGTLPALAAAQATPDTLLVTATRTPLPATATLDQTIVITRHDIDSAGPIDLPQLLRIFANADVRATGGAGQPAGIFLRGSNSSHTLVLVDGLRVNSATLGSTSIESLPLELIERIEIVKGPFSGLYGSDAIGGVIQIFTRGDTQPVLRANAGVGNNGAANVAAGFSAQEGATQLSMHAGVRQLKAVSATNASEPFGLHDADRDAHRVTHGNFSLGQTFRNGETITLSGFQSRTRTDFDAGLPGGDVNRQTLSGYQIDSRNSFSPGWLSRFTMGRSSDDLRVSGVFPGTFKTVQDQLNWVNELKTPRGHMLVGVDARTEKVSGSSTFIRSRRETTSVFTGYLERVGSQQVEFSLRRDEEDQFGARTTGSLSYGWILSPALLLHAKAGRAFRAPSFSDLYLPDDPVFGPSSNPLLLPERADSVELGLRYASGVHRLGITGFDQKIDDLVSFVFGSGPQNVRKARIRGVELEGATTIMGANIRMALTRQRPRDEDTGKLLRSRAETLASITAGRGWGAWQVNATLAGTGARFDSATESAASRMGGYATLDANIRYTIDKQWSVQLAAANLADKRYELAQGYNAPGRQLMFTVNFQAR